MEVSAPRFSSFSLKTTVHLSVAVIDSHLHTLSYAQHSSATFGETAAVVRQDTVIVVLRYRRQSAPYRSSVAYRASERPGGCGLVIGEAVLGNIPAFRQLTLSCIVGYV